MRQLKFRIWDIKHKVMCSPFKTSKDIGYVNFDIDVSGKITREILASGLVGFDRTTTENQDNYIFQQYTGLKDTNLIDICEGDIVKMQNGIFQIIWHSLGFGASEVPINIGSPGSIFWQYSASLEYIRDKDTREIIKIINNNKIIGNIYENPELLK